MSNVNVKCLTYPDFKPFSRLLSKKIFKEPQLLFQDLRMKFALVYLRGWGRPGEWWPGVNCGNFGERSGEGIFMRH